MHESLAPSATPDGIFWISSSVSASPLILIPLYLVCVCMFVCVRVCVCVCLLLHRVFVMSGGNRQNFNYCEKLADMHADNQLSAVKLQSQPTQVVNGITWTLRVEINV